MFRLRAILFIVIIGGIIYWLSPARRKRKIMGKLKELWLALTIALVLYWIFLIGSLFWDG
tara:strand:- start:564 stop:743 length:180 start_codon:yes stop_codon:yes gene_type:complete